MSWSEDLRRHRHVYNKTYATYYLLWQEIYSYKTLADGSSWKEKQVVLDVPRCYPTAMLSFFPHVFKLPKTTAHCAEEVNSRYIWTADSYEATYLVKMMGTSGWLGNRLIRIPMKNGAAQQIFMFPGFTPFYFIKSALRFIASHIRCQGTVESSPLRDLPIWHTVSSCSSI